MSANSTESVCNASTLTGVFERANLQARAQLGGVGDPLWLGMLLLFLLPGLLVLGGVGAYIGLHPAPWAARIESSLRRAVPLLFFLGACALLAAMLAWHIFDLLEQTHCEIGEQVLLETVIPFRALAIAVAACVAMAPALGLLLAARGWVALVCTLGAGTIALGALVFVWAWWCSQSNATFRSGNDGGSRATGSLALCATASPLLLLLVLANSSMASLLFLKGQSVARGVSASAPPAATATPVMMPIDPTFRSPVRQLDECSRPATRDACSRQTTRDAWVSWMWGDS